MDERGSGSPKHDAGDPLMTHAPLSRLCVLFVASGASALVAETVWLRWIRDLFGATAPAASATLVAFFVGHALGAIYAARRSPTWRNPLRNYAWIEALATLGVLCVFPLFGLGEAAIGASYDALRDHPVALTTLRFTIAFGATLPAAFAFGASFPAIGAAARGAAGELGRIGSTLYSVNLLGAALGAGGRCVRAPRHRRRFWHVALRRGSLRVRRCGRRISFSSSSTHGPV